MMDYTELVEALRCCGDANTSCSECPWDKYGFGMCAEKLFADAAAAIEALQAENMDLLAEVQDLEMRVENLAGELAAEEDGRKLEPKLGEWIEAQHGDEIVPSLCKCSVCGSTWLGVGGYNYCPNCGAKMEGTE